MKNQRLVDMLRGASHFWEGDFLSGRDTQDEQTRTEARKELSTMPVRILNNMFLTDDEVSEALAGHLNRKLSKDIAYRTLGEMKAILLGDHGAGFALDYRDGMSSELISALVKIMTNEELGAVSRKIFNPLSGVGDIVIGSRNHFGSRIQPNSTGDKEEEILFSILDALGYGCGDVMIGLNPACNDVPTVMRLVNFLADIVKRLGLSTRTCVLSDIVKLAEARERGAKVDLGFQSLAGTSKALKGMVGVDVKEILELARGFPGLYFEIGMGLEVTNGTHEGVYDMRTLTSRAAGLVRYIGQVTGKWMVVNTVTNFIGPEVFRTEEQLFRAGLEDIAMLKLHGITGGIDVCAPFHMGIHPDRLHAVTEKIVETAHPAFCMSIPGGIDAMLGYETTPSRAYPALCVKNALKMTSVMEKRLTELGVMGRCGLPKATQETFLRLYAKYKKEGGDTREFQELYTEGKRKISTLQTQNFDIGYGCPHKFVEPPLMKKRVNDIYENAQKALVAKLELAVLRDASSKYLRVSTLSVSRDDYINHPKSGNELCFLDKIFVRWCYPWCRPDVQLIISDGLNANAVNENLRIILPGLRQGLILAGIRCGKTDIFITNGRVRAGYDVGGILEAPIVIHLIGERPGTGLDTLSAYITYSYDKRGKARFHSDMDHSLTTAVCGIHKRGKHPDVAIEELVHVVKLMFEKKCSGVELDAK